jgi:malate synthase
VAASDRLPAGIRIAGSRVPGSEEILTPDALEFVAQLQRSFGPVREALL